MPQIPFEPIPNELVHFKDETFDTTQLSSDQHLLWEYMIGISTGRVNESFANRKIGPLCHARWLKLAIRILSLYIRALAPTSKASAIKQLAIFIVKVYGTSWFRINRHHYLHLQPEKLFKSVQNIKQQPDNIKNIAFSNINYNAFCLLPDTFLYCMLMSNVGFVRELVTKKIIQFRQSDTSEKINRIPQINVEANNWWQLISHISQFRSRV